MKQLLKVFGQLVVVAIVAMASALFVVNHSDDNIYVGIPVVGIYTKESVLPSSWYWSQKTISGKLDELGFTPDNILMVYDSGADDLSDCVDNGIVYKVSSDWTYFSPIGYYININPFIIERDKWSEYVRLTNPTTLTINFTGPGTGDDNCITEIVSVE